MAVNGDFIQGYGAGKAAGMSQQIAETTTAWLEENIDPDSGYAIDKSLTVENAAADAKKVGDEVGALKSALDTLQPAATASDIGKALIVKTVADGKPTEYEYGEAGGGGGGDVTREEFDELAITVNGSAGIDISDLSVYTRHDGLPNQVGATTNWVLNPKNKHIAIPVPETGCTLSMTASAGNVIYCGLKSYEVPTTTNSPLAYSDDPNWNQRYNLISGNSVEKAIADDVKFICIVVVSGDVDVTPTPFHITKPGTGGLDGRVEALEETVQNLSGADTAGLSNLENFVLGEILSKNNNIPEIFKGLTISIENGAIIINGTASTTPSGWVTIVSGTVELNATDRYFASGCPSGDGSNYYLKVNGTAGSDTGAGYTFAVNAAATQSVYIQIKSGYTATNLTFAPSCINLNSAYALQRDDLNRKTIMAIGDSMVYGQNVGLENVWLAKIRDRTGCYIINEGSNGAYMSDHPYGITNPKYNSVYQRVCNPENSMYITDAKLLACNYIVIFAGTNDSNGSITIGNTDSTNVEEFCGGMNAIVTTLLQRKPTAKLAFITPYQKKEDPNRQLYINAIHAVCESYSIPVFDNAKNGGIDFSNSNQATALTLGDNVHLNIAGHEYASTKYEAFIRGL